MMFGRQIVEFLHKRTHLIFSLLAFGERWFLSLPLIDWLLFNVKWTIFQLFLITLDLIPHFCQNF
jgi:hypothetical protein